MKVAFNQAETHPQAQAMLEFGEKLSAATDGAYEIDLFTDELLGSQAETRPTTTTCASEVVPSSVELRWRPDDHQAAFRFSS